MGHLAVLKLDVWGPGVSSFAFEHLLSLRFELTSEAGLNFFSEPVHRPVPGTPAQVEGAQVGGWSPAEVGPLRLPTSRTPKALDQRPRRACLSPTRAAKGMPLPADLAAQQPQLLGVSAKPTQGLSSSSAWSKLPIQVCG